MVKEINGIKELELEVNNNKKVLVDLWAPWCGPCKMLSPIVDKVSEELSDVRVLKVNVDDNEDIASKFDVEAIPTLLIFEDGSLKNKNVGFVSELKLKDLVK